MKCMIDANIILDVLSKRKPYYEDSAKIWKLCETNKIKGYISVLSFADIVYILRKELDSEQIQIVLSGLKLIFNFTELQPEDLFNAAELKWDDFEDTIQETSAKRIKAEYIITRNIKDFKNSSLKVYSPSEFLKLI